MKFARKSNDEVSAFLGAGTEFIGRLKFKSAVRLDGYFQGEVESAGELIVGHGAVVVAQIQVARASISGRVEGKIIASEKVEILKDGQVHGEIITPCLSVEEGAVFEGRCSMEQTGEQSPQAKPADRDPANPPDHVYTPVYNSES